MKHINRMFPAAAALLTLLSMTACGASSDAVQESAAEPAKEEQSRFDNQNSGFEQMAAALDQTENGSGNILAYGTLTGSYTRT